MNRYQKVLSAVQHLPLAALVLFSSGCSSVGYYAQAISGHTRLLLQREPIEAVISSEAVDEEVKRKLKLVQEIRLFAESVGLPAGDAYTTYVSTGSRYVVWNVFAAPEFSLQMHEFCFLVVGCTTYKGYFSQSAAEEAARVLVAEGYDVHVGGVAAYSTLGWFSDPVLDTFLFRSDRQLAGLLFHELAHRQLYVSGDSAFNESFATAVEHSLTANWAGQTQMEETNDSSRRRRQFMNLVDGLRAELRGLYGRELNAEQKRQMKQSRINHFRSAYRDLQRTWYGAQDYQRWVDGELNNAKLGTLATYNDWVPAFSALLSSVDDDIPRFLNEVRSLAAMSKPDRDSRLQAMMPKQ